MAITIAVQEWDARIVSEHAPGAKISKRNPGQSDREICHL